MWSTVYYEWKGNTMSVDVIREVLVNLVGEEPWIDSAVEAFIEEGEINEFNWVCD